MRPLREEGQDADARCDAETAREARLLRAVSPLEPSLARMQRVRMRIEAQPERSILLAPRALVAAGALAVALFALVEQRIGVAQVATRVEQPRAAHHDGTVTAASEATREAASEAARATRSAQAAAAAAAAAIEAAQPAATGAPDRVAGETFAPVAGAPAAALAQGSARAVAGTDVGSAATGASPSPASPTTEPAVAANAAAALLVPATAAAPREGASPLVLPGTLPEASSPGNAGAPGAAPALPSVVASTPAAAAGSASPSIPGSGGATADPAAPPGPRIRREAPTHGPGGPRFEPALLAQAATIEPLARERSFVYSGILDGRKVTGTVSLRGGGDDEGGQALVLLHSPQTVAEARVLDIGPASDLLVDLDSDGLDDMRISLRPPAEASESETTLSASDPASFIPDVSVLLRATP